MKRTHSDMKRQKVKFKTKTKEKIDLNAIQVPLSNKFNLLSEEGGEMVVDQKPPRVAPIIVTDFNANIQLITSELNLNYDLKIMSIGRKILPQSADDKNKITEALKSAKVNFFSHPDASNGTFKAILSGLPEIPIEEIASCLQTAHELTPSKIVMFNSKSFNKLYLCHFDKSNVNMKVLNAIKSVYHHIVTWLPYKPKRVGPTQCYRCCMYGHGISTCNRYAVCMLCSGNHTTKECTAYTQTDANNIYKCFNCASANIKHDHKANDSSCPFRAKYEETRDNARAKRTNKSTTKRQSPPLGNTASNNNTKIFTSAPAPPLLTESYASAVRSNRNIHPQSQDQSSIPHAHTHAPDSNSNLWSFAEVTTLLLNSINELKQCKSKLDQLKVIAKLLQHAV